jgi:hypothetical protein
MDTVYGFETSLIADTIAVARLLLPIHRRDEVDAWRWRGEGNGVTLPSISAQNHHRAECHFFPFITIQHARKCKLDASKASWETRVGLCEEGQ